ncbi:MULTISPECIES: PTS sugar transporter subunit IIB [Clostridium]|uniref:PTS system oligo-beta-mannoside-specific EIIB component n=2 Tax=Clostridium TaxID=1485 RepID=A0A6V8SI17_9CLOT|nr:MULTISPECIES: PTS sugar transporter subunit IIB [Clostridium]GFP74523.1 PTS system oligo-beta-mannoside-specific EIIB component [Clostridium fungisolvens]GKU26469.1 PTS sugar transporter subunit IIB [Clostridium folliculivorans]GKU29099.1 PTS sugar transporter subunit IIB [Clostridium folliculivorans]
MRKIVLLCNAGMSTSALVTKMRQAAEKINYECEINAYAAVEASNVTKGADIVFLGPQVKYLLSEVKEKVKPIPVEVIDMMVYGMMDGGKVINRAKQVLGDI